VTAYFAYGSNMSAAVMGSACPRHRFLGRARLPGHRFAFTRRSVRTGTGVADIVADTGSEVWGALYELADEDLAALDRKEGAGWAYERREVRVYTDDGSRHRAIAYVVIEKSPHEVPPSEDYARQLVEAGRERALPADYLAALPVHLDRVRHGRDA
jgi:gamma-glutamylcyclotransferase (GGCT)/AIG2-like uncharacterized protein YtfP